MKAEYRHDFKHALWMGFSTGFNAVLGLISGVLLVRGLKQDEYGLVSSAVAVMLVGQELVGRGINDSMVRLGTEAVAGSIDRSTEVFRSGLALKGLLFLVPVLLFVGIPDMSTRLIGYPELKDALPAIMAAIAGFGIWSFILTWYQARMKFGRLSMVQPISNLMKVLMLVAVMGFSRLNWVMVIWIMAAAFMIGSVIVGSDGWVQMARLPWNGDRFARSMKDVWKFASWSMLASVAFVAYNRMDVFVLSHLAANTDLAIYNASWQILTIIDLAMITIMTVMIPKASHCLYQEEMLGWGRRSVRLSVVASVFTLPLFLYADWYVPLLYGHAYGRSIHLVKVMYWGNFFALLVFPLVGILHARKAFRLTASIQVLLLILSVPVYYRAAGHMGIEGVAWATFGLRLTNCTLLLIAVFHELSKSPRKDQPGVPMPAGESISRRG